MLLHGWAMSAGGFSEIATLLSSGFRLLIPNLPGHGGSSPAMQNDLAGFAADLEHWLGEVEENPVTLIGWSLGGMLSMELAHRKRLPIERLVLLATTPRFTQKEGWELGLPPVQVRALGRNLQRRFEATLADFFSLAFAGEKISRERLRAIRTFAVKQNPLPDRDTALALLDMLAVHDQRAILSEIQQPTLLLHGVLDQITPVSAGRSLAAMLPRGTFYGFPDVGHCPFLSQPQATAERIREFVDGSD